MEQELINFERFVNEYAMKGFEMLEKSNALTWGRMYKIDIHSQRIELVYWGRETGINYMSLGFESVMHLGELLEQSL